ncbi:zinc-dependent metalloprotease [bacterium]|nr:zinc-dependent metalloprotease [bacterium]
MRKLFFLFLCVWTTVAHTQNSLPTIAAKTTGMKKYSGFFNFYWEDSSGKIWLEIEKFDSEFLYMNSLPAGLGSNDIGLDRGQIGSRRIVYFNRVGPKVLLVQPNYGYRAITSDQNEQRAVKESFAQSVLWGFKIEAAEGNKVLVDATEFFLRDAHDVIGSLRQTKQGTYRFDASRSAMYLPQTKSFPKNSEFETTVTFTGGDDAGDFVSQVAPTVQAITLRQHHSFIELPDDQFSPRIYDQRAGFFAQSFFNYSSPIGESLITRFIARHRLKKKNPNDAISEAVKPIIYYVDNTTPEPVRSALLEGASWWNQAFEAAGYKNAFQVKILPEDADPMDVRYNVIQWVHRSTRGWSYGDAITDPRTGEIIKGHVTLGSLRVRQDYLIAQGLLAPFEEGKAVPKDILEMALARIRQLSAHEVGHTLGLEHNFGASYNNRASVMDYPHPKIKINADGSIDLSDAYATGIGEWDKVAIEYGYQDFPSTADVKSSLNTILTKAAAKGLLYITDPDARMQGAAHPYAHLWDNGTDPIAELKNVMTIRAKALSNFSEKAVPIGTPMSALEDVLVPIYNFHRYQLEAVSKMVGGLNYSYAVRGDNQIITAIVKRDDQQKALDAMLDCLNPGSLTMSESILKIIPPRLYVFYPTREIFTKRTGITFDAVAPAEALANFTVSLLLQPNRAERLVEYHARDNNLGLDEVISRLIEKTWKAKRETGLNSQVQLATEQIVLTRLFALAQNEKTSYQVRAIVSQALKNLNEFIDVQKTKTKDTTYLAHLQFAAERIKNPEKISGASTFDLPPGAPIGTFECESESFDF